MQLDITKLEGYKPEMTAEEKLELLNGYEFPEPDYSGYIKKDVFDKTASDLAEVKKQLREKQTEDERREQERAEKETAILTELENLKKEKTIAEHKSQFLALGYDDELADSTAKLLAEGDMAKVFENQKQFVEKLKKATKAANLTEGGDPPSGRGTLPEDLKKLEEQNKLRVAAGLPIIKIQGE